MTAPELKSDLDHLLDLIDTIRTDGDKVLRGAGWIAAITPWGGDDAIVARLKLKLHDPRLERGLEILRRLSRDPELLASLAAIVPPPAIAR